MYIKIPSQGTRGSLINCTLELLLAVIYRMHKRKYKFLDMLHEIEALGKFSIEIHKNAYII